MGKRCQVSPAKNSFVEMHLISIGIVQIYVAFLESSVLFGWTHPNEFMYSFIDHIYVSQLKILDGNVNIVSIWKSDSINIHKVESHFSYRLFKARAVLMLDVRTPTNISVVSFEIDRN